MGDVLTLLSLALALCESPAGDKVETVESEQMMETIELDDLPVQLSVAGSEVRAKEIGGMSVAFYRFPAGADARPLLQGLPGGFCQCPHWAYVISGRLRIHTAEGARDVRAGQAFHVEAGHAPEALEDTEMFEVSPAAEFRDVMDHSRRQLALVLEAARQG